MADETITKAPWDETTGDPTVPRLRVNLHQAASGKWTSDRTVEFPAIDPLTATDRGYVLDTLNAVDELIREHIQELYRKDGEDLDRYFQERDQRERNGYRR